MEIVIRHHLKVREGGREKKLAQMENFEGAFHSGADFDRVGVGCQAFVSIKVSSGIYPDLWVGCVKYGTMHGAAVTWW